MTKVSKILYIITQSSWGGAQKYVYELASKIGQDYDVLVAGGEDTMEEMVNRLEKAKLQFIPLKNLVRNISPMKDLKAPWEIKKIIEREKPDIIHLNSSKASIVGTMGAVLSKHKTKVIYTCHGWVFNESLNPFIKIVYFVLEKVTGYFKNLVICVSDGDRISAIDKKVIAKNKLIAINNGIENISHLNREEARKALGLDQNDFIVGSIGNFYKTKGFKYLIEAADILINEEKLNIKFAIIGDGDLKKELENLITEKKLAGNFLLLGRKINASILLKAFDIYASTSIKEGFPYSILEAMDAQLPIVATAVGGIKEIINNNANGLTCDSKSPSDIADKIKLLLNDQLRNQLGQQASLDAKDKYSINQMIEKTRTAYQNI
ncbi:MAG: glycosyltransferase family 4 protein [Candidatus Buchananbacteria bacterium]